MNYEESKDEALRRSLSTFVGSLSHSDMLAMIEENNSTGGGGHHGCSYDGGGGEGESWRYGRFALEPDGEGGYEFKNCFYFVGGLIMFAVEGTKLERGINCYIIPCSVDSYEEQPHFHVYDKAADMMSESVDDTKYIIPLYTAAEGQDGRLHVVLDWRIGPSANMWEGLA